MSRERKGFVYILHTLDGKLVKVGFTIDLVARLAQHVSYTGDHNGGFRLVGYFLAYWYKDVEIRAALSKAGKIVPPKVDWFERSPEVDEIISSLPLTTERPPARRGYKRPRWNLDRWIVVKPRQKKADACLNDRYELTLNGRSIGFVEPLGGSWRVVYGMETIALRPDKDTAQRCLVGFYNTRNAEGGK